MITRSTGLTRGRVRVELIESAVVHFYASTRSEPSMGRNLLVQMIVVHLKESTNEIKHTMKVSECMGNRFTTDDRTSLILLSSHAAKLWPHSSTWEEL